MKPVRHQRFSIAMLLYVSTLFSALTFGFHQSQMVGQHIGAIDGVFCGSGNVIPRLGLGNILPATAAGDLASSCPLCSSLGHGSALTSLNWSVDYPPANPAAPQTRHSWIKPAPRFTWPALNPRASPVAFRATGLFS
ncbi:DUF2946 family protein [Halopseudomonas pelagia]|uniref:DUF2946 family protein n=1 Tax=Halopseudomonas pelagia TaxID=553151 RepID=UPI00068FFCA8|nr:DUF2946 family protein [Halopseudomonas pelagia]